MANQEKDTFGRHESLDEAKLTEQGAELREKLKESRERAAEKSVERSVESAHQEALEQAAKVERLEKQRKTHEISPAERRGPTKNEKKASYEKTMVEARSHMSAPSRAFSKLIHNQVVEKVSDAVGNTVARPNAILSGAVLAFLLTLGVYLVARMNGYQLSGSETIVAFALGWILGIVYDFLKTMITGKA